MKAEKFFQMSVSEGISADLALDMNEVCDAMRIQGVELAVKFISKTSAIFRAIGRNIEDVIKNKLDFNVEGVDETYAPDVYERAYPLDTYVDRVAVN